MTTPNELRLFLYRQADLWNAGDREAMLGAYRAIAPGGVEIEFPVGTPVRQGIAALEEIWERSQKRFRLDIEHCLVSSTNEAALCVRNERLDEPHHEAKYVIETYRLDADGVLHVRSYL